MTPPSSNDQPPPPGSQNLAEVDLHAAGRAAAAAAAGGVGSEVSEIITTPPPRVLRALLYLLAVTVAGLLLWSYASYYDVIVAERGELVPATPSGLVQPVSETRILGILATDGDRVVAGQPVLEVARPGGPKEALVAPMPGILSGIGQRRVGEVVGPGQRLAEVVPGGTLVARIQIANQQMGRVHVDLKAKVKIDAFPYQDYGAIPGRLASISDVPTPAATGAAGPGQAAYPPAAGGPPGYEATVALDLSGAKLQHLAGRLRPGLGLTAEIVVERRRILNMLLERMRRGGG
jgi:multidrug efflux pump subunit AcrA (membrane-fusion protein)